MSTTSEDTEIRCKSCGKLIAQATATIRADNSGAGQRIISQARWLLGRLQCADCAAKEGKR